MLPDFIITKLHIDLLNIVKYLDYIKNLEEFNDLDRDIVMRLSLIRTLSQQVAEKL